MSIWNPIKNAKKYYLKMQNPNFMFDKKEKSIINKKFTFKTRF